MIPTNLTAQTVQYVFLAVDWIFVIDKTLLFVRVERVGAHDRMECKTGLWTNFHIRLQVSLTFQEPYSIKSATLEDCALIPPHKWTNNDGIVHSLGNRKSIELRDQDSLQLIGTIPETFCYFTDLFQFRFQWPEENKNLRSRLKIWINLNPNMDK